MDAEPSDLSLMRGKSDIRFLRLKRIERNAAVDQGNGDLGFLPVGLDPYGGVALRVGISVRSDVSEQLVDRDIDL